MQAATSTAGPQVPQRVLTQTPVHHHPAPAAEPRTTRERGLHPLVPARTGPWLAPRAGEPSFSNIRLGRAGMREGKNNHPAWIEMPRGGSFSRGTAKRRGNDRCVGTKLFLPAFGKERNNKCGSSTFLVGRSF